MTAVVTNPNLTGVCTTNGNSSEITIILPFKNESAVDSSTIINSTKQFVDGNYHTADGRDISVNVALVDGAGGTVFHNGVATNDAAPRAYAEVGGNNVYLYPSSDNYTVAHELTHNIGLKDSYTEGSAGVVNQPGLMGTYGDHMNANEAAALYDNYCGGNAGIQIIGGGGGGGGPRVEAMDSADCMFFDNYSGMQIY
ncbi:hypothetical protein GTP58_20815 [Duganella sp. CY15W]|uniref:zinc-dependent metalloprotease family protein n=1 Tax=Duganella sp. CY15W TaxID=2692172 RepID=UPI00136FB43F|nr:zinc-dependent metalloprotease family protein [Duganella sp. CY15W]MYM30781.1 hypothetical protein [Duganella sp. CY15W]